MYGLAQSVYYWTVGLREPDPGVIGEQRPLFCSDKACMSQGCEVPAQIGLIEVKNTFKITDAQGPVMEQIQYAKSVRVSYGF
jgi:hypothetical protein